jgi:glycerol-3-phosphate O-acyltransferase
MGQSLEFFIEGTRSRTGKICSPKLGMLSVVAEAVASGRVRNVSVVPASVCYDNVIESDSYSKELLGGGKEKESLRYVRHPIRLHLASHSDALRQ